MLKLLIFWCTRRSGTGAHSDQSLLHINTELTQELQEAIAMLARVFVGLGEGPREPARDPILFLSPEGLGLEGRLPSDGSASDGRYGGGGVR